MGRHAKHEHPLERLDRDIAELQAPLSFADYRGRHHAERPGTVSAADFGAALETFAAAAREAAHGLGLAVAARPKRLPGKAAA